ncbi:hypothetical protein CI109_102747 [Kwoniella shandongensis]|uniref:Uncharacterized protein n=1 Tax=Kwoniella shandongensis TaxID=1734106 RepID=A0A5M6BV38_9TREE|nr:uncharacterized protein CI109_004930 [Kwoniella shandongensis]KAA5526727.1 hypothetical protein CI109_004930 [Kwoniella shandongensis]
MSPSPSPSPAPTPGSVSNTKPSSIPNNPSSRPSRTSTPIITMAGTPPIPNIPPRSGSISSSQNAAGTSGIVGRSFSTSFKSPLNSSTPPIAGGKDRRLSINAGIPSKSSSDNLIGRKQSPQGIGSKSTTSALTAALGTSPNTNAPPPAPAPAPPVVVSESTSTSPSASRPLSRKNSNIRPSLSREGSGTSTPRNGKAKEAATGAGAGDSSFSNLADIPDEEKAKVLRRHLVSVEERGNGSKGSTPTPGGEEETFGDEMDAPTNSGTGAGAGGSISTPGESGISGYGSTGVHTRDDTEQFPIPYDALGGDVTHDLYKWQHEHRSRPVRSASFSHVPLDRSAILDPTLAHIKEPGGFRRNFVVNRAQEQGLEAPTMVRNVVDFLFLYGHFAGEDLNEDEDVTDEEEEDEESFPASGSAQHPGGRMDDSIPGFPQGERAPLLGSIGRGMSKTRHRRTKSGAAVGTASVTQAVLMLLKGFVGTGILFMGKAFFNGGILFSAIVMVAIAGISLWSFLLLVQTYMKVPGSFGDIGGILYGQHMRLIILTSIAVSQIGFVAAYTIFIAENLQAFIMAVTDCRKYIPVRLLIFAQLIVFLPLAMIRNLAKLSGTALIADAFILIGLIYIGANEVSVLSHHGIADVALFNKDSFPLLIGTAVFAFEGIGLVIPITESMREPHKFPMVLSAIMFVVAVLFAGAGVMSYATYGSKIQTVVIVNLPQEDKFVQAVQFLYSVAILLSSPLQLFPAVRIMENGLFSKSGKHNPSVKWQKNVFRGFTVIFCSLLSWAGSSELDKFVSLIGSFACIPLCFIYPPMLHLRGVAKTRKAIVLDWILIIFGSLVGVYTTVQTVRSLFIPTVGGPKLGKCEVPVGE